MKAINTPTTIVKTGDALPSALHSPSKNRSFNGSVTAREAIESVGGNYIVGKRRLVAVPDDLIDALKKGDAISEVTLTSRDIVPSQVVTYREDTGDILGVVSESYGVVQNSAALDFINILTGDSDGGRPSIETAGILGGGRSMYLTAKFPETMRIEGDRFGIDNYLVFTNSHDGSGSVMCFCTPIRIICQNTLNAAISGARNKLTFRHTSRVNERIDLTNGENRKWAVQALSLNEHFKKAFIEDVMNMRSKKVKSERKMLDMVLRLFADEREMELVRSNNYDYMHVDEISTRKKNIVTDVMDTIENGVGQDEHRGTGFWLYNGVTSYANNVRSYKDGEAKFSSIMGGDSLRKVQHMHDLVLAEL